MAAMSAWRHSPSIMQNTQKTQSGQYANPHKLPLPLTLSSADCVDPMNHKAASYESQAESLLEGHLSNNEWACNDLLNSSNPGGEEKLKAKAGSDAIDASYTEKTTIPTKALLETSVKTGNATLEETVKTVTSPPMSLLPSIEVKHTVEEVVPAEQKQGRETNSRVIRGSDFTNTLDMRKKSLEQNVNKGRGKLSKVVSYEQQGKVHELRNKFSNLINQNEQTSQLSPKASPPSTKSNSPGLDAPDSGIFTACNETNFILMLSKRRF